MVNERALYELLAMPGSEEQAGARWIGCYRSYEDALRARDGDVLGQLTAQGGWYKLIAHMIVGPGLRGHTRCTGTRPRSGWTQRPIGSATPRTWATPDAGSPPSTGRDLAGGVSR